MRHTSMLCPRFFTLPEVKKERNPSEKDSSATFSKKQKKMRNFSAPNYDRVTQQLTTASSSLLRFRMQPTLFKSVINTTKIGAHEY